jgi:hypothetical protein
MEVRTLTWESVRVTLDLADVSTVFKRVIIEASDQMTVPLDQIQFLANEEFNVSDISSMSDLVRLGISMFDYVLFLALLNAGKQVHWTIAPEINTYRIGDYGVALFYSWFMLLTRGKIHLDEGEIIPKFLRSRMGNLNVNNIVEILSRNDMSKMNHRWVFDYDIDGIASDVINRLKKGIAGHRLLNCFISYEWREDISEDKKQVCLELRRKAMNGPYRSLHPLGMSQANMNLAFNRNLNNFMIEVFSDAEMDRMLKNKAIHKKLVKDSSVIAYKRWIVQDFEFLDVQLFNVPDSGVVEFEDL